MESGKLYLPTMADLCLAIIVHRPYWIPCFFVPAIPFYIGKTLKLVEYYKEGEIILQEDLRKHRNDVERLGIVPGLQFNLKYGMNHFISPTFYEIPTSRQPRLTVLEVVEEFATNLAVRRAGSRGNSKLCGNDCASTAPETNSSRARELACCIHCYCCFWTLPYIHGANDVASNVPVLVVKFTDAEGKSGSCRAKQIIKSMGETQTESERRQNLESAAALTSKLHAVTSPADVQMTRRDNDREKILPPDQEEASNIKVRDERSSLGGSETSSKKRRSSSFETVESMFCTNCGAKKHDPGQNFCSECGSRFY